MAYGALTGPYTVAHHHGDPPWRAIPGFGSAVPEGGFPQPRYYNDGVPDDPRSHFGYPRGPTTSTPMSSKRRRRRQRN